MKFVIKKKKKFLDYGGRHYFMCTMNSASIHQMVALNELLELISIVFGFLPKHNSENKILTTLCGFWL